MTKQEIVKHNESLAVQKIRHTYANGDLHGAMKLCQELMGVDTKEAYIRVKMLCDDVQKEQG